MPAQRPDPRSPEKQALKVATVYQSPKPPPAPAAGKETRTSNEFCPPGTMPTGGSGCWRGHGPPGAARGMGGATNSRAPTRDGSGEQDSEMELKEATGRGAALAPTRVVPAGWDAARAEGG